MIGGYFSAGQSRNPNEYVPLTYAEAQATATTTTTSNSPVLLNAMTITPQAGVYIAWFTTTAEAAVLLGAPRPSFGIYVAGTLVAHSLREINSGGQIGNIATQCLVTVDGTQTVQVGWFTSGGTATAYQRTLTLLKVADL